MTSLLRSLRAAVAASAWARRGGLPPLAILGIVVAAYAFGAFEPMERALMDTRFRLLERPASSDLVVVAIDARSLRELPSWPWPRSYHARLLDTLLAAGASEVALDIDFSAAASADDDARLAGALARADGRAILPAFVQIARQSDGSRRVIGTLPLALFRDKAQVGAVNVVPGADSLIRQSAVAMWINGRLVPSTAALLSGTPATDDSFYLDFSLRPESIPTLSYVDVLDGRFDPAVVAGKKIIVGATAVELGDQFAVPLHRTLAGPLLQAVAYESLSLNRALYRTAALPTLLLALLTLAACARLFAASSWRRGLLVLAGAGVALYGVALAVQALLPVSLDIAPALSGALALYVIGMVHELEQHARAALRHRLSDLQRQAMMRGVLDDSFDGIVISGEDGMVEMANPAAARILRLTQEPLVGAPVDRLLPGAAALRRHLAAGERVAPRGEGRAAAEFEVAAADGTQMTIELQLSSSSLKEPAARTVYIHTFRDITSRKRADERLRAAMQEAVAANRAKTEFLANMSHELRTPLNAIIGFSQLIEGETFGALANPRYREYAGDVVHSATHLLDIINDILDISMIEVGQLKLRAEAVDVADVAGRCVKLMKHKALDRAVRLKADVPADLPLIEADARLMKQIVLNLLSNAVKFTPRGGAVAASAEIVDGELVLQVADTGIGIAEADIANVMKPFYQVDGSLAREHEGAGLGLALVLAYVRLHGGTLAIDSAVGRGTTVTARFPARLLRAREEQASLAPEQPPRLVAGGRG
ncbi:MAG TPA: CHASE2 domain-containing protein [Stellaceae bacterium]